MDEISERELNCLKNLARNQSTFVTPCDAKILRHLLSLHLIEEFPGIRLPIEMAHNEYRLTQAGRTLLKKK